MSDSLGNLCVGHFVTLAIQLNRLRRPVCGVTMYYERLFRQSVCGSLCDFSYTAKPTTSACVWGDNVFHT
nr:MAG TPA: hypothetical protein [Caudoviricetes sp.]